MMATSSLFILVSIVKYGEVTVRHVIQMRMITLFLPVQIAMNIAKVKWMTNIVAFLVMCIKVRLVTTVTLTEENSE
jgi:hypothetical protein